MIFLPPQSPSHDQKPWLSSKLLVALLLQSLTIWPGRRTGQSGREDVVVEVIFDVRCERSIIRVYIYTYMIIQYDPCHSPIPYPPRFTWGYASVDVNVWSMNLLFIHCWAPTNSDILFTSFRQINATQNINQRICNPGLQQSKEAWKLDTWKSCGKYRQENMQDNGFHTLGNPWRPIGKWMEQKLSKNGFTNNECGHSRIDPVSWNWLILYFRRWKKLGVHAHYSQIYTPIFATSVVSVFEFVFQKYV